MYCIAQTLVFPALREEERTTLTPGSGAQEY